MTDYTVRNTTAQITLGSQPTTILYNEGPSTIYFGENASVTPLSGYPLAPTGQMTWTSSQPLWAVTRVGESRLRTSSTAEISNVGRGSFDIRVATVEAAPGFVTSTPVIEVGFADSLSVTVSYSGPGAGNVIVTPEFFVVWYDDNESMIFEQRISYWIYESGISIPKVIDIPVRGRYAKFRISNSRLIPQQFTVNATDRIVPTIRQYGQDDTGTVSSPVLGTVHVYDRSIEIRNWTGSGPPAPAIYLPSWGQRLTATVTSVAAATFRYYIRSYVPTGADNLHMALISPAGMSGVTVHQWSAAIPVSTPLVIELDAPPSVLANVRVNLTWSD